MARLFEKISRSDSSYAASNDRHVNLEVSIQFGKTGKRRRIDPIRSRIHNALNSCSADFSTIQSNTSGRLLQWLVESQAPDRGSTDPAAGRWLDRDAAPERNEDAGRLSRAASRMRALVDRNGTDKSLHGKIQILGNISIRLEGHEND